MTEASPEKPEREKMELGEQPLDRVLKQLGMQNSVLAASSTEQLTHKVIAKGRKGRRLTMNAQLKILRALSACQPEKKYKLSDLFNYRGK